MTNFFLLSFSFHPFNYSLLVGINLISHSIIFILSMFYSPTDSITPLSSFDYVPPYRPSSIPRNFFNWTIKALYNTTSTKEELTPLLLPLPLPSHWYLLLIPQSIILHCRLLLARCKIKAPPQRKYRKFSGYPFVPPPPPRRLATAIVHDTIPHLLPPLPPSPLPCSTTSPLFASHFASIDVLSQQHRVLYAVQPARPAKGAMCVALKAQHNTWTPPPSRIQFRVFVLFNIYGTLLTILQLPAKTKAHISTFVLLLGPPQNKVALLI